MQLLKQISKHQKLLLKKNKHRTLQLKNKHVTLFLKSKNDHNKCGRFCFLHDIMILYARASKTAIRSTKCLICSCTLVSAAFMFSLVICCFSIALCCSSIAICCFCISLSNNIGNT